MQLLDLVTDNKTPRHVPTGLQPSAGPGVHVLRAVGHAASHAARDDDPRRQGVCANAAEGNSVHARALYYAQGNIYLSL